MTSNLWMNNLEMQQVDEKTLYFRQTVGEILHQLRVENTNVSCNKFAGEYGLNDSHIGKIERAVSDCKFITLWKILEAMNVDVAKFITLLKEKLGDDFKFMDE